MSKEPKDTQDKPKDESQDQVTTTTDANQPDASKSNDKQLETLQQELEALRKQNEELKGTMSAKDKHKKTVEEKLKELEAFKEKAEREKLLLNTLDDDQDTPIEVKEKLRKKIDSFSDVDAFQDFKSMLVDSYNAGVSKSKQKADTQMNNQPTPKEPAEGVQSIREAQSIDDLEKAYNQSKG